MLRFDDFRLKIRLTWLFSVLRYRVQMRRQNMVLIQAERRIACSGERH